MSKREIWDLTICFIKIITKSLNTQEIYTYYVLKSFGYLK